ncbi:MAG: alanine racemase [Candidatus Velthaea sp.]
MRPRIELDGPTLRANVRAFAAFGAPVAAVVKNDGYNWGAGRIAREIDELVESYIVGDEDEFRAFRMHTRKPIRLLADVRPARVADVLHCGGIPNVCSSEGIAAAIAAGTPYRPAVIRVGLVDAIGWHGIRLSDAAAFARLCAHPNLRVELWTHVTSPSRLERIEREFDSVCAAFRAAGAAVASTDVASTSYACARRGHARLRIGIGLFGVRLSSNAGLRCAVRVSGPVVRRFARGSVAWSGYGETGAPSNQEVDVVRCGYGDGLPKVLAGTDDILSVGMQYTVKIARDVAVDHMLIGPTTDLDALAARAAVTPHEIVVGLAQRR